VLQAQTEVLQEQLGAQVWPYVNTSEGIDNDSVQIALANDGLGPAVLRSLSATVDGVSKSNFIDIMHALLGPNIVARTPRGQKTNFGLSGASPGSVVRPGETIALLTLNSKEFARPLLRAFSRVRFRICYCAIIPGKCWMSDSSSSRDPQPAQSCPELPGDLLHAPTLNEVLLRKF
jgi:hypothetical protein